MWLELVKNSDGIQALFVIGPENADARQKLFQALINRGADTGRQKSATNMSAEFTTLDSVWLLNNRAKEHALEDLESLYKQAIDGFEEFLADQLPKLDAAIEAMSK